MSWYRAGSVTVANGSNVVIGAGTDFVSNSFGGDAFVGPDGRSYEIAQIVSATELRLVTSYQAAGGGGQAYAIQPTQSYVRDLALQAGNLVGAFAAVRDNAGQGLFQSGTEALPGIRGANDQDTGLIWPGGNVLGMIVGGVRRFSADGDGAFVSGRRLAINGGTVSSVIHATNVANWSSGIADGANRWAVIENQTGSEFLSIVSGGNVGVGIVNPASRHHVKSPSANVATLEGTAARGSGGVFMDFRDAGGRKGYVGYAGSDDTLFLINSANASLSLGCKDTEWLRLDAGGTLRPGADNTQSLGTSAFRWASIFAVNGTIQTSDQRSKRDISDIPDEWLDAWADVQWCRFKFTDAVEAKADEARWHVGLIAQHVRDSFAAHGLDAERIGLLCYDQWDATPSIPAREEERDDDGKIVKYALPEQPARPAGDRWGLRYDECQAIEAAYQRRRIAQLEAKVAQLSAQHG